MYQSFDEDLSPAQQFIMNKDGIKSVKHKVDTNLSPAQQFIMNKDGIKSVKHKVDTNLEKAENEDIELKPTNVSYIILY